jgi:Fe2+ or Zn2+ uptake regulation protein
MIKSTYILICDKCGRKFNKFGDNIHELVKLANSDNWNIDEVIPAFVKHICPDCQKKGEIN